MSNTKNSSKVFVLAIIIAVIYGAYIWRDGQLVEVADRISYFGFTFAIASVLYASLLYKQAIIQSEQLVAQSKATHDWNRRQFAMDTMWKIKEGMNKHILILDKKFGYLRREKSNPIAVKEIHDEICGKGDKGEFVKKEGARHYELCRKPEAEETRKAIKHVLNSFEYLAAGVYQGVFDRKTVLALYGGTMKKVARVFSLYIEHFNGEMYPDRGGDVWVHLKDLGADLEKGKEPIPPTRKATG